MTSIFVNLSNHPSTKWSQAQLSAAGGEVADIAFPNVPPIAAFEEVEALAASFIARLPAEGGTVHIAGESCFVACFLRALPAQWSPVCSTTERVAVETPQPDGSVKKEVVFQFLGFRRLR